MASVDGHSDPPTRRRQMPQELTLMRLCKRAGTRASGAAAPYFYGTLLVLILAYK